MMKARKAGVSTPCVFLIDSSNTKIYMEKIDGVTAKQFILDCMDSKSGATTLPRLRMAVRANTSRVAGSGCLRTRVSERYTVMCSV